MAATYRRLWHRAASCRLCFPWLLGPVVSAPRAVTAIAAPLYRARPQISSSIHNVVHWYPTGGHLYCDALEVRRGVGAGGWTVSREARTTDHRWSLLLTCPSTSRPDRREIGPAEVRQFVDSTVTTVL